MRQALVFCGVLALAAALRGWGLAHGLPFTMGRPDEAEALAHTAGFPAGDLNPHWLVYPNLFFWLLWGWLELVLAATRLVHDVPPYAAMVAHGMPTLILDGRLLSALAGTATVGVVYALGRRSGGALTGATAALLLATNFLHVRDSHALKADVFLALAIPLALAAIARFAAAPRLGPSLAAGAAIGVATGVKYPGVVLAVPAWVAIASTSTRAGIARLLPERSGWALVAAAIVTGVLGCPYLLLDHALFARTFTFSVAAVYGTHPPGVAPATGLAASALAWLGTRSFLYHLRVSLWQCSGPVAAVLLPFAVALGLRSREPLLRLAAVMLVVYYLVVGVSEVTLARYWTAVTPLAALVTAHLIVHVAARAPTPAGRRAAYTALVALALAWPLEASVAHDRIASATDTRVLATRWMATSLPAGAVVARAGSLVFHIADPELPPGTTAVDLERVDADLDRLHVGYLVTHEHPLPFSRPSPALLAHYRDRLTPLAEFSPWADGPAGRYEDLDAFYIPYADFAGVVRPGPLVRVFRLEPAPAAR